MDEFMKSLRARIHENYGTDIAGEIIADLEFLPDGMLEVTERELFDLLQRAAIAGMKRGVRS